VGLVEKASRKLVSMKEKIEKRGIGRGNEGKRE